MARESTIQVLRSTTTDTPTGLTFGELAYSSVANKLFVGDATGNAVWIGGQVTSGSIATNSANLVPTQSAVKTYVDGIVGGGSVVNSINGTGGNITVTGDGQSQFVSVSGTTTTITNRLATTSATGVASFNSSHFSVSTGAVSLASGYQVTGDTVAAVGSASVSRSGNVATIDNRIASTSVTGVASFNGTRFTVSAGGAVDLATAFQTTGDTVAGVGAISVSRSGNAATVDSRLATTTATGAASFSSTNFDVAAGAVSIKTGGVPNAALVNSSFTLRDEVGATDTISLGDTLTITGGRGIDFLRTGTDTYQISGLTATSSQLGVASFNTASFAVTNGDVTIKSGGVSNTQLVNSSVTVSPGSGLAGGGAVALGSSITLTNIGVTSFNGATGAVTYAPPIASSSVTGVASFNGTRFTVSAGGAVDLATAFQTTGDTVSAVGSASVSRSGNVATIDNRIATTGVTGVASFSSGNFDVAAGAVSIKTGGVSNTNLVNSGVTVSAGTGLGGGGAVSLGGTVTLTNLGVLSLNGLTGALSMTGDGGAVRGAANNIIAARLASTSVTGAASFNSASFDVSAGGDVTIKNAGVSNTQLANSSITVFGNASNTISLGGTLTITGTANQVAVSSSSGTVTLGLPNDITIPGNLTVNGTVVTANVDSFVVEDPLFMLGTGNAADSVDLGFYGQYTSAGKRYTGLFRDASDSGKYKLFTSLTGGAEPTSTVNTGGAGYAVATLVVNIDGGTF